MNSKTFSKVTACVLSMCMLILTASGVFAANEWAVTINSVDTAANTASVTINTAGDYTAYIAVYEGGVLESVESAEVTSGTVQFDGTLSFNSETQTLRCYVWDEDLTPAAEVYETGVPMEEEQTAYKATFVTDEHVSVTVSTTQSFDSSAELTQNATEAYARASKTGEIDISGSGQVNFKVVLDEGYVIDTITALPTDNYNKFNQDPEKSGDTDTYRITKMTGDVTVTITTKLSDGTATDDGSEANVVREGDIVLSSAGITSGVDEQYATVSEDGSTVTILYSGTYNISGSMEGGQIAVSAGGDAVVNLNLNNVAIDNSASTLTPFYAIGAKVNLVCTGNISFTDSASNKTKACVYSKKDLSIKSADESNKATVTVSANRSNGIRCEKDLEIGSVNMNVTAVNNGLKGDKSVKLTKKAGNITIVTTGDGDGIKSDLLPSADATTGDYVAGGEVTINGGNINITTGSVTDEATGEVTTGDGIQADSLITIANSPTIEINAKGEALKANASSIEDGTPAEGDGCIVIKGGTLTLTAGEDGIKAAKDITISGGNVDVTAAEDGIQAGDIAYTLSTDGKSAEFSRIDGTVTVSGNATELDVDAGDDGIVTTMTYKQTDGTVTVDGAYDGIQAGKAYTALDVGTGTDDDTAIYETNGVVDIEGGSLTVTAYGGASDDIYDSNDSNGTKKDFSCKGIKARRLIDISDGTVNVDAYDDAFHSAHTMNVSGGELTARSCDDGLHAEYFLNVTGGSINVTKCYEGLEAAELTIDGGETTVYAFDDGANASGTDPSQLTSGKTAYTLDTVYNSVTVSSYSTYSASDITLMAGPGGPGGSQGGGGWGGGQDPSPSSGSKYGKIYIKSGYIYVTTQYGDGIDSNGDMAISGGIVVADTAANNQNKGGDSDGLDSENGITITGGYVLTLSMGGMESAETFSQKSVAYGFTSGGFGGGPGGSSGSSISAGDYCIVDSSDTILCAFKRATGGIARVLFSSPSLTSGTYYIKPLTVSSGASPSGMLYGTVNSSNYTFTADSGCSVGSGTSYTMTTY